MKISFLAIFPLCVLFLSSCSSTEFYQPSPHYYEKNYGQTLPKHHKPHGGDFSGTGLEVPYTESEKPVDSITGTPGTVTPSSLSSSSSAAPSTTTSPTPGSDKSADTSAAGNKDKSTSLSY